MKGTSRKGEKVDNTRKQIYRIKEEERKGSDPGRGSVAREANTQILIEHAQIAIEA